jgi:hypothetical protein
MGAVAGIVLGVSQQETVRAELSRLLESPAFRTSKRCRLFLEYVVEHTMQGTGDTLKERALGVELFQLPPDFDAGQHTIVRVTANEVRKKLAQHYLTQNGSSHAVRIDLPPGSYRAEFRWEAPVATPAPLRPSWWRWEVLVVAGLVVIAAIGVLWRGRAAKPAVPAAAIAVPASTPKAAGAVGALRMFVGSDTPYTDRSGKVWSPDRHFAGGSMVARGSERVSRTLDPDLYRRGRSGDFRYDLPLDPGSYELHLHFAETSVSDLLSAESSGEGQRIFHVTANGKRILNNFDVVADAAGTNIADERVFRDIAPAQDGLLHLAFVPTHGTAILSGIEALPVAPGTVRPVRIRAGWPTSWQDPAGQTWQADQYFMGGNALVRPTSPVRTGDPQRSDVALYSSERWGHFTYSIPVADGRYRVTLRFCERHHGQTNAGGGGVGSRLFDVYCNGVALLRNFDVFKEAGGEGRPLERAFSAIRPTAQGKIVLTFVPVEGMACVNGIEVVEDTN